MKAYKKRNSNINDIVAVIFINVEHYHKHNFLLHEFLVGKA